MRRTVRIAGYVALGVAATLLVGVVLFLVLTRTEFGLERVRRFLVDRVAEEIRGELRVERIETDGLLGGALLLGLAIDDEAGRPFLRADSIRLRYDWRSLAAGRIVLERVAAYDPEVYATRLPGDTAWNYEYIFPDTTPDEGPDRLVLIRQALVRNGLAVVRIPWEPDEPVEPEDTARLILERVDGGYVRVLRFEDVDAVLPRVLWDSPIEEGKYFRVAELSMRGYLWEEPFHLTELEGVVTVRDSLVAFELPVVRLPGSRLSALGRVVVGEDENGYDVAVEGEQVEFEDFQWLYPRLPREGGGNLLFRVQSLPEGTLWLATDAHLVAPGTEVAGSFGIVTGDTLYFTNVDLRASPLNMDLVQQLVPGELPLEGLLVGTVEVEGPLSALETRGDIRLTRAGERGGQAAVRWEGVVDARSPASSRRLDARVEHLDLALLSALRPQLDLRGTVSGNLSATGRSRGGVRFAGAVRHELGGRLPTRLAAQGTWDGSSRNPGFDVRIEASSIALGGLAEAVPGLARLQGELRGPIAVTGTPRDLLVRADLEGEAGRVSVRSRFDLSHGLAGYDAEGRVEELRLDRLLPDLPETRITGRFDLRGRGTRPDRAAAGLEAVLDDGRMGGVRIHGGTVRLALDGGMIHLDTLLLRTEAGWMAAEGTLGLAAGRAGTLRLLVQGDSLAALQPLLFPDDVPAAGGEGAPHARVSGSGRITATVAGTVGDLAAEGTAFLHRLAYDALDATRAEVRFRAGGIGSGRPEYRVQAFADSLAFFGTRLHRFRGDVSRQDGVSEFAVLSDAPRGGRYHLAGQFQRPGAGLELTLDTVEFRAGEAHWNLLRPAGVRFGSVGLAVDDLELIHPGGPGRLRAEGRIPWRAGDDAGDDAVDFRLTAEHVSIGDLLRAVRPDPRADGILSAVVEARGTPADPRIHAEFTIDEPRHGDVRADRLSGTARYGARLLEAQTTLERDGRAVLTGTGRIPVELALMPVPERRLAEPLRAELRADSLPLALVTDLLRGFHDVQGSLHGTVAVGGTTRDPTLGGAVRLERGAATWEPSGARYHGIRGSFRLLGERTVAVEATARTSASGRADVNGTIVFRPLTDPQFDLVLRASDFLAARRRDVEFAASGELRLGGRYTRPIVTGDFRVDGGALYLDEVWREYQIVQLERSWLFEVVDTSRVAVESILPGTENPFLENLVVDAGVRVGRDSWLRGQNINVELAGDLTVYYDRRAEDLRLSGALDAVRGFYQVYGRRFEVREGTVEFVGTPGINPNLDITATYRARTVDGDPLDIRANVTGTLQTPRLALGSNAEPPISQSDLVSYLLFGRPTYALAPGESSALGQAFQGLGIGLAAPSVLGYVSTGLEAVAEDLGLDYVAVTAAEAAGPAEREDAGGLGGIFAGTRVEVGRYLSDRLFLALSQRITGRSGYPGYGARLEWRFHPTWTAELFVEDRFARTPSFGIDQSLELRKVYGLFLFREWGY